MYLNIRFSHYRNGKIIIIIALITHSQGFDDIFRVCSQINTYQHLYQTEQYTERMQKIHDRIIYCTSNFILVTHMSGLEKRREGKCRWWKNYGRGFVRGSGEQKQKLDSSQYFYSTVYTFDVFYKTFFVKLLFRSVLRQIPSVVDIFTKKKLIKKDCT